MRFIHIADVHLGMQPDAGFPWSEERGEAIWESFRRIIRLAGREKTDFLLIAGDLFQCQPLLRELKEVNDLFASIPETIVVLIAGNHDYVKRESFYRGFDWADNVVMLLSPEPECVEVPEKKTAVYGCSYDKKEILENRLDGVRATLLQGMANIRADNNKKLDEIRGTMPATCRGIRAAWRRLGLIILRAGTFISRGFLFPTKWHTQAHSNRRMRRSWGRTATSAERWTSTACGFSLCRLPDMSTKIWC